MNAAKLIFLVGLTTTLGLVMSIDQAGAETTTATGMRRYPIRQFDSPAARNAAPQPKQAPASQSLPVEITTTANAGYRVDELKWNIAADPSGTVEPNILSELTWDKIQGATAEAKVKVRAKEGWLENLVVEGSAIRSATLSGDNQDSDYFSNNRADEFSRSNNSSDTGWMQRYSGSLGYGWKMQAQRTHVMTLTPKIGYQYSKQRFVMRDGVQTVASVLVDSFGNQTPITPPLGPFAGLRSRYETEVSGPTVGLEYDLKMYQSHHLNISGAYFWGDYEGVANWNLRDDFAHPRSFDHQIDIDGWMIGATYGFAFTENLELLVNLQYETWNGEDGRDTVYFSDNTSTSTRLNEVDAKALAVSAGVSYQF